MAKYLNLWEIDNSRLPTDPKERATRQMQQLEAIKKMLAEGQILDWGLFAGGGAGYAISEGAESDMLRRTLPFGPSVKFHLHPILSVDQVIDVMKSMQG